MVHHVIIPLTVITAGNALAIGAPPLDAIRTTSQLCGGDHRQVYGIGDRQVIAEDLGLHVDCGLLQA